MLVQQVRIPCHDGHGVRIPYIPATSPSQSWIEHRYLFFPNVEKTADSLTCNPWVSGFRVH